MCMFMLVYAPNVPGTVMSPGRRENPLYDFRYLLGFDTFKIFTYLKQTKENKEG